MPKSTLKILFFADTHLGFDLPLHPRIQRRRRGDDFFANYHHILNFALTEKVDLLIHGGDFFFRNKVSPFIIEQAFEALIEVARAGIPIYLVPGNHERSKLPGHLWLAHPKIRVFDKPRTFYQDIHGYVIALTGFPFMRKIRDGFQECLGRAGFYPNRAAFHFLCLHQTFEGAQVGPADFTFRKGVDNIPGAFIPQAVTAVLSGHIHRSQTLTHALDGLPLPAPVIYPGSIERTSFAERFEEKHFVLLEIHPSHPKSQLEASLIDLPTRPMVKVEVPIQIDDKEGIKGKIREVLFKLDPDSIVQVHLTGPGASSLQGMLSNRDLRGLAPRAMNITLVHPWKESNKGLAQKMDQNSITQSWIR